MQSVTVLYNIHVSWHYNMQK